MLLFAIAGLYGGMWPGVGCCSNKFLEVAVE